LVALSKRNSAAVHCNGHKPVKKRSARGLVLQLSIEEFAFKAVPAS